MDLLSRSSRRNISQPHMVVVAALGLLTSCADVPSVEWYYQDCDADGVPNLGAYDVSGDWVEAEKGQFQVPDECQDEADRESCWNSKWKQTDSNLDDCRGAISVDAVETTRSNHAQSDQELDDCDDHDANIRPAYDDSSAGDDVPCDTIDQDCDGTDLQNSYYPDSDGDGYGTTGETLGCAGDFADKPVAYVTSTGDCDDEDADEHPDAWEQCGSGDEADDVDCEAGFRACALTFDDDTWSTDGVTAVYLGTRTEDLTPDDGDSTTTEVAYAAIGVPGSLKVSIVKASSTPGVVADLSPTTTTPVVFGEPLTAGDVDEDGRGDLIAAGVLDASDNSNDSRVYICQFDDLITKIAGQTASNVDDWCATSHVGLHSIAAVALTTMAASNAVLAAWGDFDDSSPDKFADYLLVGELSASLVVPLSIDDGTATEGPLDGSASAHDYTTWPVSLLSLDVCGFDGVEELLVGVGGETTKGQVLGYEYESGSATLTKSLEYLDDSDATAFGAALMALPNGGFAVSATYPGSTGNPGDVYLIEVPVCSTDYKDLEAPVLRGEANGDEFGYAMSMIGDISGDGADDFAVGAPGADQVYVFLGPVDAITSTSDAIGIIEGKADTRFGHAISPAGDMNLDGYDDFFVAAPAQNKVYLIYGGP